MDSAIKLFYKLIFLSVKTKSIKIMTPAFANAAADTVKKRRQKYYLDLIIQELFYYTNT